MDEMAGLADHGIDLATLRVMYDAWCAGASKSDLERAYLNAPQSHGKLVNSLVRAHLGIETEKQSPQTARIEALQHEVERLRRLLREHGIQPNESAG
jgi:hypothetical protein